MNKLSKALIIVVILLIVALIIVSYKYFDMKEAAKESLRLYINSEKLITLLIEECPELENVDIMGLRESLEK